MLLMARITGIIVLWGSAMCILSASDRGAEDKALAAIKNLKGQIVRDKDRPGKPVVGVALASTAVKDNELEKLKVFPHLKVLSLDFTRITDKGLVHLQGFTELETLTLSCTFVGDEGMEHISALTNLRTLSLSHTRVTYQGLKRLKATSKLQHLNLNGVMITEEDEKKLRETLPNAKIHRGNGNTAENRVRMHFAIPAAKSITKQTIQSTILSSLSLGSSEDDVYAYLKKRGIGKDSFSSYYPLDKENHIVCRIEFDPESGELIHRHYCIVFSMDDKRQLRAVEVKVWLTGP